MTAKSKLINTAAIATSAAAIILWSLLAACSQKASQQTSQSQAPVPAVTVTKVVSQELSRQIRLPGELQAYQDVAIYPKVQGFVEWIGVDRGSVVKQGQLLCRMSAPELAAQRSEAAAKAQGASSQRIEGEARVGSIQAQKLEAAAKLASDDATYKHLKAAAATPGVVAGNDLETAERTVEADRARVRLYEENEKAARAQVQALTENEKAAGDSARSVSEIESYLRISAPFDGVITERNVHKGSLVGPSGSSPMLRVRQVRELRLVIYVPEADVAGMAEGNSLNFTVTAYPGETFSGKLQRVAHSLDAKTRTMPVELDVLNSSGRLAPGMYTEVVWPNSRTYPSQFIPPSAIATTTERTFVIRIRDDKAEWVDVKRGVVMGDLVEVFGNLAEGDMVAVRGTDELRDGTKVTVKQPSPSP
jgi:membrane fusion protein (multidrug efflux system)